MSKLGYTPGCSVLDPWSDPLISLARPRRRSLRWGVAFHKDHDHPHDHMGRPGPARYAGPSRQVYTIGIAGPVGSGKTALVEALCRALWPEINLAVITNDIYTHEDAEFLSRSGALPVERIIGILLIDDRRHLLQRVHHLLARNNPMMQPVGDMLA